jgi:hypothetical protein
MLFPPPPYFLIVVCCSSGSRIISSDWSLSSHIIASIWSDMYSVWFVSPSTDRPHPQIVRIAIHRSSALVGLTKLATRAPHAPCSSPPPSRIRKSDPPTCPRGPRRPPARSHHLYSGQNAHAASVLPSNRRVARYCIWTMSGLNFASPLSTAATIFGGFRGKYLSRTHFDRTRDGCPPSCINCRATRPTLDVSYTSSILTCITHYKLSWYRWHMSTTGTQAVSWTPLATPSPGCRTPPPSRQRGPIHRGNGGGVSTVVGPSISILTSNLAKLCIMLPFWPARLVCGTHVFLQWLWLWSSAGLNENACNVLHTNTARNKVHARSFRACVEEATCMYRWLDVG